MKNSISLMLFINLLSFVDCVRLSKRNREKPMPNDHCTVIKNKISTLVSSNKNLQSHLTKCTQKDRCPIDGPEGIYNITVHGQTFETPCKPTGWMVIQRRADGSEDFFRNWETYKRGFGDIRNEFFIGLDRLHLLTKTNSQMELYVKLRDVQGVTNFARYDSFKIGSEEEFYKLNSIGNYSGTAGDSLDYHKKMKFSTFDKDNDADPLNCAVQKHGGWWFNGCSVSALNGPFYKDGKRPVGKPSGILWLSLQRNSSLSLTFVEMMIKHKC